MGGTHTYVVEREARIAAPASEILGRIGDFRRWQAWSPWEDVDPNLRRAYSASESGVGAVYEWEGDRKAGKGRMEITAKTLMTRVMGVFTSMDKMIGPDFEKGPDRLRADAEPG